MREARTPDMRENSNYAPLCKTGARDSRFLCAFGASE